VVKDVRIRDYDCVCIGSDMRSACEAYRPATSAEWDTPLMSFMCNAVEECALPIHDFSTASVGGFVRYSIASRRLGGPPVAFHSPESAAQRGRCSSKSDLTWRSTSAVQRSAAQRSAVQCSAVQRHTECSARRDLRG